MVKSARKAKRIITLNTSTMEQPQSESRFATNVGSLVFTNIGKALCGGLGGCVLATSIIGVVLTTLIYVLFFIYAFANPDKDAWLTSEGGNFKLSPDAATAGTGALHIHAVFTGWFAWFFINMVAQWVILGISVLFFYLSLEWVGIAFQGIMSCLLGCSFLAMYIAGMVWRFNSAGRYAAGSLVPEGTSTDDWAKTVSADGSLF